MAIMDEELLEILEKEITLRVHDIWQQWLGLLFKGGEMIPNGCLVLNPVLSQMWWRQRNSSFEELTGMEKKHHQVIAEIILTHMRLVMTEYEIKKVKEA